MPKLAEDLGIQATVTGLSGQVGRFQALGADVQLAYLQGLWQQFFKTVPLKAQQAQGMLCLLNGQKPQVQLDLEGDLLFKRVYDRFFIQKNQTLAVSNPAHFQLELNHWQSLPDNSTIGIFDLTSELVDPAAVLTQTVTLSPADFPITVRRRQAGDRYQLPNGHHGKVKKLLIDRHVPSDCRDQLWLVFAKDNLIWIPTFRFFQLFQTTETDRIKFMLCFKQNR
jgi:tRNA(Ile)-lysidine synthase